MSLRKSLPKGFALSLVFFLGLGCSDGAESDSDTGLPNPIGTDGGGAPTQGDADVNVDGSTPGTEGGSNPDESCRRVDVVIAVDGSSSMGEERKAMHQTVFPAFAKRLISISKGLDDFRVATIDACPTPANFHTRGGGGECNFFGGNPWIESSSPNIESEFACVGNIYLGDAKCSGDNDDEQPASSAATALEDPFLSGANKGFLRDDALLIIIAITDEDEQPTSSAKTAEQIYQRIVALKGGQVQRVVFLGIGSEDECDGAYGSAWGSRKLKAVTDLFVAQKRGVWWDLCDGRLEDGLEDAFSVIESACDELPIIK